MRKEKSIIFFIFISSFIEKISNLKEEYFINYKHPLILQPLSCFKEELFNRSLNIPGFGACSAGRYILRSAPIARIPYSTSSAHGSCARSRTSGLGRSTTMVLASAQALERMSDRCIADPGLCMYACLRHSLCAAICRP